MMKPSTKEGLLPFTTEEAGIQGIFLLCLHLLDKEKKNNVFIRFLSGHIQKECFSKENLSELYLLINFVSAVTYCYNTCGCEKCRRERRDGGREVALKKGNAWFYKEDTKKEN